MDMKFPFFEILAEILVERVVFLQKGRASSINLIIKIINIMIKKNQKKWWHEYRPRKKEILKIVFEEDMSFIWKMKIFSITCLVISIIGLCLALFFWENATLVGVAWVIAGGSLILGFMTFFNGRFLWVRVTKRLEDKERRVEFIKKLKATI